MGYVRITKEEIEDKLKSEKGWVCAKSGNEYIYDFHLSEYPIIIKVASSVRIDTGRTKNNGSTSIRVFAVKKEGLDKKDKITGGLVKATRIHRTGNWKFQLEQAVYSTIRRSKIVYRKVHRNG